jgi:hypothetical protein
LALDRIAAEEAARRADALEPTMQWLQKLVDPRSVHDIRVSRVVRITVGALMVVGSLVLFGVWALSAPNIALRKPATASSMDYATTAAGAVDGEKSVRFGFHSHDEDSPWLQVDLGDRFSINLAKVYGRSDCCFDQSIPLIFEVSDDGTQFRQVAQKTDPFKESSPWQFSPSTVARYVRLRVAKHGVLVLSEVELFGRKH